MRKLQPGGFFGDEFREKLLKNNREIFHISWKKVNDVLPCLYSKSIFEGEIYMEETNMEENGKLSLKFNDKSSAKEAKLQKVSGEQVLLL